MKRHLRTALGLSVTLATLTGIGAVLAAEKSLTRIAPKLWPAEEVSA